mmetsp:Transcript_493/g.1389  ORF Transcript_493/g.1389 Transcript_493/m.1389 type:complete len:206 (+) Transcript_493:357-974(+)
MASSRPGALLRGCQGGGATLGPRLGGGGGPAQWSHGVSQRLCQLPHHVPGRAVRHARLRLVGPDGAAVAPGDWSRDAHARTPQRRGALHRNTAFVQTPCFRRHGARHLPLVAAGVHASGAHQRSGTRPPLEAPLQRRRCVSGARLGGRVRCGESVGHPRALGSRAGDQAPAARRAVPHGRELLQLHLRPRPVHALLCSGSGVARA